MSFLRLNLGICWSRVGVEVQPSGFYTFIKNYAALQGGRTHMENNIKILINELLGTVTDLDLLDLIYKLLLESMQSPPGL